MKLHPSHILSLIAALFVVAFAPNAASAAPAATDLERVSNVAKPGIVYLETTFTGRVYDPAYKQYLNNGKPFSVSLTCSGFFVSPNGHIVSAGHCVDPAEGRDALTERAAQWSYANESWTPDTSLGDVVSLAADRWKVFSAERTSKAGPDREVSTAYGIDAGGVRSGKSLPARVLGLRPFEKGDVSLLKVEAENTPALELAPDADLRIGSEIVSVGYAGSVDAVTDLTFDPSFKDGAVSSERTIGDGLVKAYEISAAVTGGQSGGPTVDLSGRVVGVNSFGIVGEPQAFNFVTPVSEVTGLLADEGVENELGKMTELYRAGLVAYYAGDREKALAAFDGALGIARDHELAQEFRGKALRLPKAEAEGSGLQAPLAIGALFILLAGGLGIRRIRGGKSPRGGGSLPAFLSRRRQDKASHTAPRGRPIAQQPSGAPTLLALDGPIAGRHLEVAGAIVFGRKSGDVLLDDELVSRRHAEVRPLEGGLVLTDLGSSNGTTVNGRRCEGVTHLAQGDKVQIGSTVFMAALGTSRRDQETKVASLPSNGNTTASHSLTR